MTSILKTLSFIIAALLFWSCSSAPQALQPVETERPAFFEARLGPNGGFVRGDWPQSDEALDRLIESLKRFEQPLPLDVQLEPVDLPVSEDVWMESILAYLEHIPVFSDTSNLPSNHQTYFLLTEEAATMIVLADYQPSRQFERKMNSEPLYPFAGDTLYTGFFGDTEFLSYMFVENQERDCQTLLDHISYLGTENQMINRFQVVCPGEINPEGVVKPVDGPTDHLINGPHLTDIREVRKTCQVEPDDSAIRRLMKCTVMLRPMSLYRHKPGPSKDPRLNPELRSAE